jgi:hypothetical protein
MSYRWILLPLFVEVALTLGLIIWLALLRRADLLTGAAIPEHIALREPNWPVRTRQVANAFSNQFELPVLFYLITVLAMITQHADYVFVALAWIFALSRLIHAYIHTTSNVVLRRGAWYGVGLIALMLMWAIFMVRILFGFS